MDKAAREMLEKEVQGLKGLLSVAQVVVSSLNLDEVLDNILASAMAVMEMPAGSIVLFDEKLNQLELHAHSGLSRSIVECDRWRVEKGGLSHRVIEEGALFVVEDTEGADFFTNPLAVSEGIRSLVGVPLKVHDKVVGILYLDDFQPRTFNLETLNLLSILSSFAAMSIDNARLHEETRRLASTDGLTGLFNYRHFRHCLQEELIRSERYRKCLSLVMFDVDDFKQFNDTFGHPAGDKALAGVAKILVHSFRECDVVFRYGGEEFTVILPEAGMEEALVAAERARFAIEAETPNLLKSITTRPLTVSVGVATFPRDGKTVESLLEVADQLMYMAKKFGKNKVYHLSQDQ